MVPRRCTVVIRRKCFRVPGRGLLVRCRHTGFLVAWGSTSLWRSDDLSSPSSPRGSGAETSDGALAEVPLDLHDRHTQRVLLRRLRAIHSGFHPLHHHILPASIRLAS
jgi:hypothetical protein